MAGSDSSRKPLKTLVMVKDRKYPMLFRLQFKEGGVLPENLQGMYNMKAAEKAIENYVEGYDRPKIYPKAPKNDKPQRSVEKDGEDKDSS